MFVWRKAASVAKQTENIFGGAKQPVSQSRQKIENKLLVYILYIIVSVLTIK